MHIISDQPIKIKGIMWSTEPEIEHFNVDGSDEQIKFYSGLFYYDTKPFEYNGKQLSCYNSNASAILLVDPNMDDDVIEKIYSGKEISLTCLLCGDGINTTVFYYVTDLEF